MPYLIDGHNLIPKIPGLTLQTIDDEERLIEILQDFYRRAGKPVEVYFDNAPAGFPKTRKFGGVTAHFVSSSSTADAAIQARLRRLGRSAPSWIVVSSDHAVQRAAKACHAKTISAETFAAEMFSSAGQMQPPEKDAELTLKPDEITEWLQLFEQGDPPRPRP